MQLKQRSVNLLGLIVNGECVEMPREQKEKIFQFKRPKTKKELQSFLGAINYHKRFIDQIGEKTAILHDLLKDNSSMKDWTQEHTKAFEELQTEANKNIVRYHPNYDLEFIVETDASDTGVGAILYQIGKDGEKRIIKPASAKLKKNELNWGITEKEMFAVVWAIKKFELYLKGRRFKIITDHKASIWLKDKDDFGNKRIQRWMEALQEFDFVIEYKPGVEMHEVDALSRINYDEDLQEENRKMSETQRNLIVKVHLDVAHRGPEVTEYELRKRATVWPNQNSHIKQIIDECEVCSKNKNKNKGGEEFIDTSRRLEIMGVDILEVKETYILLVIDYFTRYAFGTVLKSK